MRGDDMLYTIGEFWDPVLKSSGSTRTLSVAGWSFQGHGFPTFKEAPLKLDLEITDDCDPKDAEIFLVSAPGAVGKTTLAKQIAYKTHSVYVDLSTADPVGGGSLTGWLHVSGLNVPPHDQTAILIDGLDEARLKVTHASFEAFLKNVVQESSDHKRRTVIFGRTAAIEDAWLLLKDHVKVAGLEVKVAGLEIGYYEPNDSVELADLIMRSAKASSHQEKEKEAAGLILERLRRTTQNDGSQFAGYAPVIDAVARRVSGETNCGSLISTIKNDDELPITLEDIARDILVREKDKLVREKDERHARVSFKDPKLRSLLYKPTEQVERLIACIYDVAPPLFPPGMSRVDEETYSNALDKWVPDHPFLGRGRRNQPVTSVFDAFISAKALLPSQAPAWARSPERKLASERALVRELKRGAMANPFLYEFYLNQVGSEIPSEHVGVIYSSLRASLSGDDTANLTIDEIPEEDHPCGSDGLDELRSEVEITVKRGANPLSSKALQMYQDDIRFGAHVEDVFVVAANAKVVIGAGEPEATLVSPINIRCREIEIAAKVFVEPPEQAEQAVVVLHADVFSNNDHENNAHVKVYQGVELICISGKTLRYPWVHYSTTPPVTPSVTFKVVEALQRFRNYVIVFRAHGRGRLARSGRKLGNTRMAKGTGKDVFEAMVAHGILSKDSNRDMYYLDPDKLFNLTGVTYKDCMAGRLGQKAAEFVQAAI